VANEAWIRGPFTSAKKLADMSPRLAADAAHKLDSGSRQQSHGRLVTLLTAPRQAYMPEPGTTDIRMFIGFKNRYPD